jgi:3-hydroxyisobutyrate dehydrogenase
METVNEVGQIGFVGMGAMGSAMAARLVESGHQVTVYNRTSSRCKELLERGAKVADTPEEAARGADLVLLSLADEDVVESLVFGGEGAASGLQPGAIVADLSTVSPDFARRSASRLAGAGQHWLDACLLGNPQHARNGELVLLIGGEERPASVATPVLRTLARELTHLGPSGMAATAKLALQVLKATQLQGLVEAIVFGERAGLSSTVLIDMIAKSGFSSPVMKGRCGVMARRSFDERPNFRLTLMRKDLNLALEASTRLGVPMPATSVSQEVLTAAMNTGLGEYDCAAILTFMENVSGLSS